MAVTWVVTCSYNVPHDQTQIRKDFLTYSTVYLHLHATSRPDYMCAEVGY